MNRNLLTFFTKGIEYLFYGLFFLVPIVFSGNTSELFEFNKMWLTFAIASLIAFFWIGKMIIKREFRIQRTPLDIPILLFLLSQIISTIFSMDSHVSLWGYYSRFNGGLLSFITYIFLYYAFVSNFIPEKIEKNKNLLSTLFEQKIIKRMLFVSIASGIFVSLWGLPSHFGYDPTCLVFRGHLDVSCWTTDFQPKVRIFSSLGQPDWLAAYLAILAPISIGFALKYFKKGEVLAKTNLISYFFAATTLLFYIDLLFTRAKSGFIGFWISMAVFLGLFFYKKIGEKEKPAKIIKSGPALFLAIFIIVTFFLQSNIDFLDKFTFPSIISHFSKQAPQTPAPQPVASQPSGTGELGGSDSGKIRLIVWKGAINIWKNNPVFGTGVETYAFAYYKYRPVEHNLTSEWNFLYNKAHNEYLNFMATTGTFGIVTYMMIILGFLWIITTVFFAKANNMTSRAFSRLRATSFPYFEENSIMVIALTASFVSILVTNFFGFSVVITNIYLFIIPAFAFYLLGTLDPEYSIGKESLNSTKNIGIPQWIGLGVLAVPTIYILLFLFNSWNADQQYALGSNLDHAGEYQQAYPYLQKAVQMRGDEPVFKDELSNNDAALASALITQADKKNQQQDQAVAQQLASEAISISNQLTTDYPNNIIFWKSRVRIYYTLAQLNQQYLPLALAAIQKAAQLAPTEASISYNLGVLYGQSGDSKNAVSVLENTIKLKPDYGQAHYALGLFYHDQALDKNGKVVDPALQAKAEEQMKYLLSLDPTNDQAQKALDSWNGITK